MIYLLIYLIKITEYNAYKSSCLRSIYGIRSFFPFYLNTNIILQKINI